MKRSGPLRADLNIEENEPLFNDDIFYEICSHIKWQDVDTMMSIILTSKKSFIAVALQYNLFFSKLLQKLSKKNIHRFPEPGIIENTRLFNLCNRIKMSDESEGRRRVVERGRMYFILNLVSLLSRRTGNTDDPEFSELTYSNCYFIEYMNYSFIPLSMKKKKLNIEAFEIPEECHVESDPTISEVEQYAIEKSKGCKEYSKVLKFFIFEKYVRRSPVKENTKVSNMLIEGIPFYSKSRAVKNRDIFFKKKDQNIFDFFCSYNSRYSEICCQLLDREYTCSCDYHDSTGCTYYE